MIHLIIRRYKRIKPFLDKIKHDNIFAIAGQSAFFLILSSVPLSMFGVSILQNLHIPVETLNSFFGLVLNKEASETLSTFLGNVYDNTAGISMVTIIATLWSAAKGLQAITNGLNRVHGTYENRNWLVLRLRSMLYTVIFIFIMLATILLVVMGSWINSLIAGSLKDLPDIVGIIYRLRYLIVYLYLVILFALIYRNVPNLRREVRREYNFRCQLPGASLCAAAWIALSFGISVYVADFNGFSLYGSLTKLAVIMVWLYFCLVSMMLGAEINYFYQDKIRAAYTKVNAGRRKE